MPPSKNRINMHDIISQPLGVLPAAVDSVLRRPESLDEVELQSLFSEASYLLLRAEEALSVGDEEAGSALIQLLLEGLSHSEQSHEVGLTTFAVQDGLLDSLRSLFTLVFKDTALPIHSSGAADLAQIISALSDGDAVKEACGELFMADLACVLQQLYETPSSANRHFQTQRSVAAALINLVKGSTSNKERVSEWSFILPCFTMSIDIFFQLQCVEIMYRVSRRQKRFLKELAQQQQDVVRAGLTKLDELPNDPALLGRMLEVVEGVNEGRADIIRFLVREFKAAETLITTTSKAFFTPHYFIVLIDSSSADNVTVPFDSIRSVTIGRDAHVMFRLETFPMNLEAVLSHTGAGMDTVTLALNTEQLARLKASAVRSWIIKALECKKLNLSKDDQSNEKKSNEPEGVQGVHPSRSPPSCACQPSPTESTPTPLLPTPRELTITGPGHPTADTNGRDTKRLKKEIHEPLKTPTGKENSVTAADGLLQSIIWNVTQQLPRVEKERLLEQLDQLLQEAVDDARERCKRNRDEWAAEVSRGIALIDNEVKRSEDAAATAVEQLNGGLHQLKLSNQALSERMDALRFSLQQVLEESRGEERDFKEHLLRNFEAELERHDNLYYDRHMRADSAQWRLPHNKHYSLPSLLTSR
eukprot:gene9243-6496_t